MLKSLKPAIVAVSLLLAAMVSASVIEDCFAAIGATANAIFVDAPLALDPACGRSFGSALSVVSRRAAGQTTALCHQSTNGSSFSRYATIPRQTVKYAATTADWVIFISVFVASLLLWSVVGQARADYRQSMTAGAVTDKPSPSPTIMSYPQWVAFLVYATILIPAAYFSIGTLLYLRTDQPSADMTAFINAFKEADQANKLPPPPPIGFDTLTANVDTFFGPDARFVGPVNKWSLTQAINNGRTAYANVTQGPRDFQNRAIGQALQASRQLTSAQVADYKAIVIAQYPGAVAAFAARTSPCFSALSGLEAGFASRQQATSTPATPPAAPDAVKTTPSATPGAPAAAIETALTNVTNDCRASMAFDPPFAFTDYDQEPDTALGRAFNWMAACSESTVLIVGLVGFGLFGAAIRMMGRPDKPDGSGSDDTDTPADLSRSNSVVAPKADGGVALTGAAPRVLVQGIGAAFTVFLGGQAGALLLTTGSTPNVYSLLLLCFVGAVFAEEIWSWARSLLKVRLSQDSDQGQPQPQPAPQPAPTPAPPGATGVNPDPVAANS